jgi:hypothetical protein
MAVLYMAGCHPENRVELFSVKDVEIGQFMVDAPLAASSIARFIECDTDSDKRADLAKAHVTLSVVNKGPGDVLLNRVTLKSGGEMVLFDGTFVGMLGPVHNFEPVILSPSGDCHIAFKIVVDGVIARPAGETIPLRISVIERDSL